MIHICWIKIQWPRSFFFFLQLLHMRPLMLAPTPASQAEAKAEAEARPQPHMQLRRRLCKHVAAQAEAWPQALILAHDSTGGGASSRPRPLSRRRGGPPGL